MEYKTSTTHTPGSVDAEKIVAVLTVYKTEDDLREVGTLAVRDGEVAVETEDEVLRRLVKDLAVTADMLGRPVSKSDPDYALAVADSLARQSGWTYTAEPARG